MWNIIGHRKIFLSLAALLIGASLVLILFLGFREGIDFSGGALWRFRLATPAPDAGALQEVLRNDLKLPDAQVNFDPTTRSYLVRMGDLPEEAHNSLQQQIEARFSGFEELSFQSIGPSIGQELRRKSIYSIVFVLLGISLYIAYAFRKVYRPVSSWKYGWITLFTLFHDVAIPAGMLAVLGYYFGVEIDGNFIVALLVIMGFSVHDTIVVFDRIRENLVLNRGQEEFGRVINRSINETLARSINTSLTLILVLLALYFAGPITLRYFILTLLVGVVTGMYSSIFVASPLLLAWQQISDRKRGT